MSTRMRTRRTQMQGMHLTAVLKYESESYYHKSWKISVYAYKLFYRLLEIVYDSLFVYTKVNAYI